MSNYFDSPPASDDDDDDDISSISTTQSSVVQGRRTSTTSYHSQSQQPNRSRLLSTDSTSTTSSHQSQSLHSYQSNSSTTPSSTLLAQKKAQITRLETLLKTQTDAHLTSTRTLTLKHERKLDKTKEKYATHYCRVIDKLNVKYENVKVKGIEIERKVNAVNALYSGSQAKVFELVKVIEEGKVTKANFVCVSGKELESNERVITELRESFTVANDENARLLNALEKGRLTTTNLADEIEINSQAMQDTSITLIHSLIYNRLKRMVTKAFTKLQGNVIEHNNVSVTKALAIAQTTITSLERSVAVLVKEVSCTESERDVLNSRNNAYKDEEEKLRSDLTCLEENLENERSEKEYAVSELEELRAELEEIENRESPIIDVVLSPSAATEAEADSVEVSRLQTMLSTLPSSVVESDAISSTIIQLRSTLAKQQVKLEGLEVDLEQLKVEKRIAIEQAGQAKLESLSLAARLKMTQSVREMDAEIDSHGTASSTLSKLKHNHSTLAASTFDALKTSSEGMKESLVESSLNSFVAEEVNGHAVVIADNLFKSYKERSTHSSTGIVQHAQEFEGGGVGESSPSFASPSKTNTRVHFDTPVSPTLSGAEPDADAVNSSLYKMDHTADLNPHSSEDAFLQNELSNRSEYNASQALLPPANYHTLGLNSNSVKDKDRDKLQQLMIDLQTRVANEIYTVSEHLFSTIDSDYREQTPTMSSKQRADKPPVTDLDRKRFSGVIGKCVHGTLRWLVLIYLRAFDGLDDLLREAENTEKGGVEDEALATATTILQSRLEHIVPATQTIWEVNRRDPTKAGNGSLLHDEIEHELGLNTTTKVNGKIVPFQRTQRRSMLVHEKKGFDKSMNKVESERRSKLYFLDTGAGPREFWSTVGSGWSEIKKLSEVDNALWKLVVLVRCQDRSRGLRLQRHESQRKLLDLRIYELLLQGVQITLVKEKAVEVDLRGRFREWRLKFNDVGKWVVSGSSREEVEEEESGGGGVGDETGDLKYFQSLTREFERVRKDRLSMSNGRASLR